MNYLCIYFMDGLLNTIMTHWVYIISSGRISVMLQSISKQANKQKLINNNGTFKNFYLGAAESCGLFCWEDLHFENRLVFKPVISDVF